MEYGAPSYWHSSSVRRAKAVPEDNRGGANRSEDPHVDFTLCGVGPPAGVVPEDNAETLEPYAMRMESRV